MSQKDSFCIAYAVVHNLGLHIDSSYIGMENSIEIIHAKVNAKMSCWLEQL